jgi:cation transport regulator ChaC
MRAPFFKFYCCFLMLFLTFSVWAQELLKLASDEVAMVAYGSLMNKESLEKSLGHAYTGPFLDVELEGWKRSWNVGMPNEAFYTETKNGIITPKSIVYLNITPDSKTSMNAVLFVIKKSQLESFNRREWIYDATELSTFLKGAKVEGGEVLGYVGKKEFLTKVGQAFPEVAIRQSYIDTVESAIRKKGESHYLAYKNTTQSIPSYVMQDKVNPEIDVFGYKKVTAQKEVKKPINYSLCLKQLLNPAFR